MTNKEILHRIKGGLIVSCQALCDEPLHSSFIMGRMALAAKMAGAVGIRANTVEDILEIRSVVGDMPIIGIIKQQYAGNCVYITPTIEQVKQLVDIGCEIIATDATDRPRPDGKTLEQHYNDIRALYPHQLLMADCSTAQEAIYAANLGFDIVATTLAGYTEQTRNISLPALDTILEISSQVSVPVIAEGGIHTPDQLKLVYHNGAYSAVVGSAITRPQEIASKFVQALAEDH